MNRTNVGITISLSSLLGAVIGGFLFKDNPKIKWWGGALIGFFALPFILFVISLPFGIWTSKS